ncbi:MAG: tetratricopeptide repeat protein [Acidobacteria bacterium]|nr:tetratricopeptide repeat protein [Acidobacteriota bacterium]
MQKARTSLFLFILAFTICPAAPAQTKPSSRISFASLAAKADAARDADRLDEAVVLYRKALALRPSWAEGWWSLGTIQYDRNAYADAARALQKVTVLVPDNGNAYAMLGLCEFELGREELSLQHIEKGKHIGIHKDEALGRVLLYHEGVLLQRKGSFQAAQETLEELCLRGGNGDEVANALGMTLLRMTGKAAPAQGSTDANVVLRVGRAECLAGQKKYDEARPAFEEVVKDNPTYPNIHYAFGLFLMEIRDVVNGVEQFKQEIANHPDHVLSRLRIAACLYKEDSAAAIPYAEEAVKLSPGLGFAHYLLGLLLLDADQSARAIPELEIAQKTFARDPRIYAALGSAYSRTGRKQAAAQARVTFDRLNKEAEDSKKSGPQAGDLMGIPLGTSPRH